MLADGGELRLGERRIARVLFPQRILAQPREREVHGLGFRESERLGDSAQGRAADRGQRVDLEVEEQCFFPG